ncbi:MAG: outer membrane protein assembly factor BamA [Deltaproteobacteria bacterium]|nr:outer membrane protein assembly factor BamA [Deltaproteobacteria bacterium]
MRHKIFILLFSLFSFLPGLCLAASTISKIEIGGEMSVPKEQILHFLPFKVGDDYDPKKMQVAVENLKKWGIFDIIELGSEADGSGILVKILLHQAEIISDIEIQGNYPYIKTKLRKRLNLHVGDMAEEKKLEEQVGRIKSFYEKEGFYHTNVEVSTFPDSEENNVYVVYHIIKGERLRYDGVQVEGVHSFMKGRVGSFVRPMSIYTEKRLRDSLRELTNFYKSRGYLRVHVHIIDKKIDWKTRRVSLKLVVREGPRMKIFFSGNPHYRIKTLKKALGLYEEVNFDTVELQNSADTLKNYFKKDGYPDAKVTFKSKKISPSLYHIYFDIHPGIRNRIKTIEFSGNNSISENKLQKQIFTKEKSLTQKGLMNEAILKDDQKIVEQYYQSRGFLDADVSPAKIEVDKTFGNLKIDFPVVEGSQVFVEKTVLGGNENFKAEEILKDLKNQKDEPLNEVLLPYDKEQVQLFYANNGYPYAQVQQSTERHDDKITIIYTIHEGPLVRIGEVLITGDVLTSQKAILKAMVIKRGAVYSHQKIVDSQLGLRHLGAFNTVNIETIGLEEKETTVHLYVKVEERPPFVVSAEVQYSTDLKYAGTLKFTNLNAFGWAKQNSLLLRGGAKTSRAELAWFDPRFIGADVQMTVSSWMDYEKNPIETSLQTGGATAFFRQFHRFGFLERYELTRTYNLQGQSIDPTVLRDSTLSEISSQISFDTRNSYSDPSRGIFALTRGDIINEIKGLGANFAKIRFDFINYFSPLRRITFSNSLRLDEIKSIGANVSVPQIQLYGLGGDDTVRGFKEDVLGPQAPDGRPSGGRSRFIYNSELHIRVVGALQWAFFFDAGALTNSYHDFNSQTVRRSGGFGLRYITPVGPIRLDYGIILDPQPGDNFGRLHFTFGYPF